MEAKERKKILFVASECVPFIKTGGLADVVGSLPKDIDPEYYDVRVMIPKYSCMKQNVKDEMELPVVFDMGGNFNGVATVSYELPDGTLKEVTREFSLSAWP